MRSASTDLERSAPVAEQTATSSPAISRWLLGLVALVVTIALPSVAGADDGAAFKDSFKQGGLPAASGAAFVAGLLTSLTPCVYPMIAITVSVFGAKEAKSRGHAMALSTAFVAGMVVLFTAMFVIVSLTGGVFGAILGNRWVIVGLAAVFVVMAASMFGAFELTLPDSVMQRLSAVGGVGYGGAFTLGLVSGLVAAPCSGPVLISMMAVVTESQSVPLGVAFGLSYAIGLGLLFWVVGTFAAGLPKGGKWMVWVKSFFGIVMLVLALYYLKNAFPALGEFAKNELTFILVAAGIGAMGLALGAVHVNWDDGGIPTKIRKGVGIAASVVGGFLIITALGKPKELSAEEVQAKTEEAKQEAEAKGEKFYGELVFGKDLEKAKELAKEEGRPMILDFGATWCGACNQLEKETFAAPEVKFKFGRFVAVKYDATKLEDDDPEVLATMAKYNVKGLPAVLIFDSTGKEVKRITEFVPADKFAATLSTVQ